MMTRDATTGIRLEGTPQSPARDEFMRVLTAHEDACSVLCNALRDEAAVGYATEAFRMSRRMVVAAYDQAALCAGGCQPVGSADSAPAPQPSQPSPLSSVATAGVNRPTLGAS